MKKIFNKKFIALFCCFCVAFGTLFGYLSYSPVNADSSLYGPFNTCVLISDNIDATTYEAKVLFRINSDNTYALPINNNYISIHFNSSTSLALESTYLMKLTRVNNTDNYTCNINDVILYNNYIFDYFGSGQYNLGFYSGYQAGIETTDYQSAYNQGVDRGQSLLDEEINTLTEYYNNLLNYQYDQGKQDGYNDGYRDASDHYLTNESRNWFVQTIDTVISKPFQLFKEMFSFEIFGINFYGVVTGILGLLVAVWFIKKVI